MAAWDCEPTSEPCRSLSPRPALFHAAPASPGWGRSDIQRSAFAPAYVCPNGDPCAWDQTRARRNGSAPTSIRANIVGPPSSTTSNRHSIAACHSGVSCSAFGSLVMQVPASCRVTSCRPREGSIGSSKGRFQPLPQVISWLSRASNQPTRPFQWQGRYIASSCLPRRKIMRGVKPP